MILTGDNKKSKPTTMAGNQLSAGMIAQIDSIVEKADGNSKSAAMNEGERKKKIANSKQKARNAETLLLVLPKGERQAFKSFCADNNISMTEYIYTCMDYVRSQVNEGKMTVSRGGIHVLKNQ